MKRAHLFIFMCMCVSLSLCTSYEYGCARGQKPAWYSLEDVQVAGSYRKWVLGITFGSFGRAASISNHSHLTSASERTGLDGSISQFIPFVSLTGFRIA